MSIKMYNIFRTAGSLTSCIRLVTRFREIIQRMFIVPSLDYGYAIRKPGRNVLAVLAMGMLEYTFCNICLSTKVSSSPEKGKKRTTNAGIVDEDWIPSQSRCSMHRTIQIVCSQHTQRPCVQRRGNRRRRCLRCRRSHSSGRG